MLVTAALILWIVIAFLPWQPWRVTEQLNADNETRERFDDISVLIPARNEAEHIASTLAGVAAQGDFRQVIVVDDESDDDTEQIAQASGIPQLEVISGQPPETGWSGKLWALHQGVQKTDSEYVLLLDADIRLAPGIIAQLRKKAQDDDLALASLMVELAVISSWDKLLLPAFIYFFKLLYPFRLANRRGGPVAAAAGGCILLRADALARIGGFASIRDALIDDCTLARAIKNSGQRACLWLTRSAKSTRTYDSLRPTWEMVVRSAYTQLHYSVLLLMLCTGLMIVCFIVPLLGLFSAQSFTFALISIAVMAGTYLPTVRFYRLKPAWALSLPLAGALFLAMTWTSALRYWRGERSRWKARTYVSSEK